MLGSVYLRGMPEAFLIQGLGDQGTYLKSGDTSKAEEMVAKASGKEGTSRFVGDTGETQLPGALPLPGLGAIPFRTLPSAQA